MKRFIVLSIALLLLQSFLCIGVSAEINYEKIYNDIKSGKIKDTSLEYSYNGSKSDDTSKNEVKDAIQNKTDVEKQRNAAQNTSLTREELSALKTLPPIGSTKTGKINYEKIYDDIKSGKLENMSLVGSYMDKALAQKKEREAEERAQKQSEAPASALGYVR